MHWFITDETNTHEEARFFLYGGLVFTDEQAAAVHDAIEGIRARYRYEAGDRLKFAVKVRPSHLTPAEGTQAKAEVLEALLQAGVRMIVNVTHWGIARSRGVAKTTEWAINTVADAFHTLLVLEGARGAVSVDRIDQHGFDYLQRLFQEGLTYPSGFSRSLRDRIVHLSMTSDNASHLSSAVDIALGGLRYCVNTAGGVGRTEIATEIFPSIAKLLWAHETSGLRLIREYGYIERPQNVISRAYAEDYRELRRLLSTYAAADAETMPKREIL